MRTARPENHLLRTERIQTKGTAVKDTISIGRMGMEVHIPLAKTHLRQRDGLFIADGVAPDKGGSKGVCLADGETHLPDGMDEWVERVTGLSLENDSSDSKGYYPFRRRENGRLVRRAVSSAGVIRDKSSKYHLRMPGFTERRRHLYRTAGGFSFRSSTVRTCEVFIPYYGGWASGVHRDEQ